MRRAGDSPGTGEERREVRGEVSRAGNRPGMLGKRTDNNPGRESCLGSCWSWSSPSCLEGSSSGIIPENSGSRFLLGFISLTSTLIYFYFTLIDAAAMLEMTVLWFAKITGETEQGFAVLAVHLEGSFLPGTPELHEFSH